jgi:hypothetical protein
MEKDTIIESLLTQIASSTTALGTKIDTLTAHINTIQLDQANFKGEMSSQLLKQAQVYDQKLLDLERRFEGRLHRRDEKDNEDKIALTKQMSGISVKIGAIMSGVTLVIGGIIAGIVRFLFSSPQ